MKKRLLSTLLALCVVLALLPITAWAAETSGKCGDNVTWSYSNGTLTIQGKGKMEDYPRNIFFQFGESRPWYDYCNEIRNIYIGDGVTSIGSVAFMSCTSLNSVTIPNSVTSIGADAFSNCTSLTSVSIPNGVTRIENFTFSFCTSLISVTIPDNVTSIGEYAFRGCSSLTSLTIPNSVNYIYQWAFMGCDSLSSLTIPNSVFYIGDHAFSSCINLTSVSIPESVISLGYYAFSGCINLTSVTIESVDNIRNGIFESCRSLKSITIPNGTTRIEQRAFMYCTGLISVTIPDSITYIGEQAFFECSSLTDVYYGGSESQWELISINEYNNGNDLLFNATIHYNSTGPSDPPIGGEPGTAMIVEVSPARNATDVEFGNSAIFTITFDREILTFSQWNYADLNFDAGTIKIFQKSNDTLLYEAKCDEYLAGLYDYSGAGCSNIRAISDSTLQLAVDADLFDPETTYYVTLDAGFVQFTDEVTNPAIAEGVWEFTTARVGSKIRPQLIFII